MSYTDEIDERTGNYLLDHWQGNLSLPISYWINGNLVAALNAILILAVGAEIKNSTYSLQMVSVFTIALIVVALSAWIWGAAGIWRSASKHASRGGTPFWAFAAQAMVVIGALNTSNQLAKIVPQLAEYSQLAVGHDPIGAKATLAVKGDTLSLNGWITSGTAAEFATTLNMHPEVRRLTLKSAGGRVRDATQIAAAVQNRALDTIAVGDCSSSCTIVFLAGTRRFAEVGSSLGFHSPSEAGLSDDEAQSANPDMRTAYSKAGLPVAFIDRAMATSSKSIWQPREPELVEAGVINSFTAERIVESNRSIARDVNAAGRKKLDEITTLAGAKASGEKLVYLHTLSVPIDRIDRSAIDRVGADVGMRLCENKINRLLIQSGASYSYEYRDSSDNLVGKYTVENCPPVLSMR